MSEHRDGDQVSKQASCDGELADVVSPAFAVRPRRSIPWISRARGPVTSRSTIS